MAFQIGQKVRVVKLRDLYTRNYLGKTGMIRGGSKYGYHVILDDTGQEATFFEDELENVRQE